ncbi:MAG: histidinol phosphate phosphatase domain-containing protein [Proteobacteria bacterium]|nr:histidinol phosphate phosphatase domain-containing protein [Pseudomonadota bacterium]
MIDLHTHTIYSDGELIPFELVRRAENIGYKYIALTDHMDFSSFEFVIPKLVKAAKKLNEVSKTTVIPGCEITHIPPSLMKEAVREARKLGAKIVIGHGESPVEPVLVGTNRSAIDAKVDILAHPGLITEEDVKRAIKNNVILEITARGGHNITNGHVAKLAKKYGALVTVNTDAHSPRDLITFDFAKIVAIGAGFDENDFYKAYNLVEKWLSTKF